MRLALILIFNFSFSYSFALHADSTWSAEIDAFVKTVKRIELVRVLAEGPFYRDDIYKVKENNPESILDPDEEKDFKAEVMKLKAMGIKTEPAFAQLLALEGDPYLALLNFGFAASFI